MVKKAEVERTSIRVPVPTRDEANAKAKKRNMNTLEWLTELIHNAEG